MRFLLGSHDPVLIELVKEDIEEAGAVFLQKLKQQSLNSPTHASLPTVRSHLGNNKVFNSPKTLLKVTFSLQ
jgi:hypothetical protein